MKFLAVLIIVFVYRNWIGNNPARDVMPFDRYVAWFRRSISVSYLRYLLCVGLPTVVVLLISIRIGHWMFGLLWLLLALLVLLYAVDIFDTDVIFDDQTQALRSMDPSTPLSDASRQQEDFRMVTIYTIFQGIYPALFWFLLLGPAATIFYALSRLYLDRLDEDEVEFDTVDQLVYWMEWPAVRITGLVFALVGRFGECFQQWLESLFDASDSTSSLILRWALAAIGDRGEEARDLPQYVSDSEYLNSELKDLLDRTLFGWLGIAAIVAIIGV